MEILEILLSLHQTDPLGEKRTSKKTPLLPFVGGQGEGCCGLHFREGLSKCYQDRQKVIGEEKKSSSTLNHPET
jgi:hypothetical protein